MRTSPAHLPSLLGSLLFILGAVFSLGVALVLGVVALGNLLINGQIQASETILLTVLGFEGLLLVGATYISIQKFLERPSADADSSFTISSRQIAACLVVAVTVILTGHLSVNSEPANWLLIPLLTLPAVILPIFILFSLAIRGITLGPRWRTWNVLGISMTLVPFWHHDGSLPRPAILRSLGYTPPPPSWLRMLRPGSHNVYYVNCVCDAAIIQYQ